METTCHRIQIHHVVCCTCFFDFSVRGKSPHQHPIMIRVSTSAFKISHWIVTIIHHLSNSTFKTDTFRRWFGDDLCPLTAILFRTAEKQPLTHRQFVNKEKTALKSICLDAKKILRPQL